MTHHHSKPDRAARAQAWVAAMERDHANEIQSSIARSVIYDDAVDGAHGRNPVTAHDRISASTQNTEIILDDIDSVSAVCKYAGQGTRTALLNFASFKNPGGGFIRGAMAQEECRQILGCDLRAEPVGTGIENTIRPRHRRSQPG